MPPDPPERPPLKLGGGRFLIVDRLGDGGTATVWLAWDVAEQRWCALKALHHKYLKDQEMRRRFDQEAQALEILAHPNVPRLFFHDPDATPPFMVMELARCGSTMDWVREHGRMPPAMAADVMFQVCQALAEAHAAGIVHRDVKPHNFLLDDEGHCKLTDFGIARVTDNTSLTTTGSQIGTFSFMAPEQRSDTKSVDHRADIYSVGAALYTLLTARTSAELFVADKDDDLLAEVPPAFRDLILKATRYRPEDRYASVLDLQTDLMSALSRIPPGEASYPPLVRPPQPLPKVPPRSLPLDKRFEELEKAMGLDPMAAPRTEPPAETPAPAPAKKVIPYYMPVRATTPPRPERQVIPAYVDNSELGALRRQQEAEERARLESRLEEEVRAALPPPPPPEPVVEEDPHRSRAVMAAIVAAALVLSMLAASTGLGALWVRDARAERDAAADALTATLQAESGVVYEIDGDRAAFERIYERYRDSEGEDRLRAALQFVEALDGVVSTGTPMDSAVEPKVRRLQMARDGYVDAREHWARTAARFPGRLAVRVGIVRAP